MREVDRVFIVLIVAITIMICTGIMYGKDTMVSDVDDHYNSVVIHQQDVCIGWYTFRYFFQGDRLVNVVQVFENKNGKVMAKSCNHS